MVSGVAIGAANFAFSVIRRLDIDMEIGRSFLEVCIHPTHEQV